MRPPLLLIFGPTAIGKSQLALELAAQLDGEIVSVDSTQVYRGLDIGTAKPSPEERAGIPHHLIDLLDPAEHFSAGAFRELALPLIERIAARGRVPILVGGTMLYFHALLYGISPLPRGEKRLREAIDREAEVRGWPALHERLRAIDPTTAARIHKNDRQRIQRALELFYLTGKPPSLLYRQKEPPLPFPTVQIALVPQEREQLYRKIARRFRKMVAAGLVEEVARLFGRGDLTPDLPAIRSVGYRQLWDYLEGRCGFAEAVARGIRATCQLAKRQLSWLRHFPEAERLPVASISRELIKEAVQRWTARAS